MLKLLVVEDDRLQADLLVALLRANGHMAQSAITGLEGLQLIRTGLFDAALIDYRLPEMNGLALARVASIAATRGRRPRMIGLTNSARLLREQSDLVGFRFDAIVGKPYRIGALLGTIQRCCAAGSSIADEAACVTARSDDGPATVSASTQDMPSGRPRVLLVDDDELMRLYLQAALNAREYDVDSTGDAFAALRLLRERRYDVAVFDYQMPGLDGIALASCVRDLVDRARQPCLVALTAAPEQLGSRGESKLCRFDMVVSKMHGTLALLESVRNCIDHKLRREAAPAPLPIGIGDLSRLSASLRAREGHRCAPAD